MITVTAARATDWPIIEQVAKRSWHRAYADVLSAEQIHFMLQKSYSKAGILAAMDAGQTFYLAQEDKEVVGFIALFVPTDASILRIEKLYLLPEVQGKGYGGDLIAFAEKQALNAAVSLLELNVNRKNKAYFFYCKQGFQVVRQVDIPYYGFVLDDYVMQKRVSLR